MKTQGRFQQKWVITYAEIWPGHTFSCCLPK